MNLLRFMSDSVGGWGGFASDIAQNNDENIQKLAISASSHFLFQFQSSSSQFKDHSAFITKSLTSFLFSLEFTKLKKNNSQEENIGFWIFGPLGAHNHSSAYHWAKARSPIIATFIPFINDDYGIITKKKKKHFDTKKMVKRFSFK